jgi:hypothetical protein
MDLLKKVDWQGRQYLVYMDAEFQTFRLPAVGDSLAAAGYANTPYLYGMKPTNVGQNNYHFLLNLGFIVFDGTGRHTYNFALFPSLFDVDSPLFNNGQMLEPGYTTCRPDVASAIEKARFVGGDIFPFYKTLALGERGTFRKINHIYNSSITEEEHLASVLTLKNFLTHVVPNAVLVHKGQNDLFALRNSALHYGIDVGHMITRDLDAIPVKFPGLSNKRLNTIQNYVVNGDPAVKRLRDAIMAEIAAYFQQLWSDSTTVAAHNPLVDCAYAMVMDIGLLRQ